MENKSAFAAVRTLERLGFVYCGGDEWIPTGGSEEEYLKARIDELEDEVYVLERMNDDAEYKIEWAVKELNRPGNDLQTRITEALEALE
ncbi:hypothetical protein R80B4_00942 [Fibrobacteres bacterium R8-0-B4]